MKGASRNARLSVWPLAAAMCVPPALAFVALVAAHSVPMRTAALAFAATAAGLVVVARHLIAELSVIEQALNDLPGAEGLPPKLTGLRVGRWVGLAALRYRRHAHRRLAQAEAVAYHLPVPLLTIDADQFVIAANLAAVQTLGRAPQGRPLSASFPDPPLLEAVEAALDGETPPPVQITHPGPVETVYEIIVTTRPPQAGGRAHAWLLIRDITAFARNDKMRTDFIADASHELRTPLTNVMGFIETLQKTTPEDHTSRERFLAIMFQQATRMRRLIEDLLLLSQIELHQHVQPSENIFILDVLTNVITGLEPQARSQSITLVLKEAPPLVVIGAADELTQIFENLLDNAIKYGRVGSTVQVVAEAVAVGPASMPRATRNACVKVTVTDQSEGIRREYLPRLTERFYRVDAARGRPIGGAGLGLSIVKHIVKHHRGALTIDSVVGEGSVFSVYLPGAVGPGVA